MEYSDQFKLFNPFKCTVPDDPFIDLPNILYRCNKLLNGRTIDQITDIALNIDWVISEYFREIKENEISRLQYEFEPSSDESNDFFIWDGGTRANGRYIFNDSKESELQIATSENTRLFDALVDSIDYWDDLGGDNISNFQAHESFAILSMWLLVDTLRCLNYDFLKNIGIMVPISSSENDEYKYFFTQLCLLQRKIYGGYGDFYKKYAANFAMEAMEAICYAEHLYFLEVERIKLKEINQLEKNQLEKNRRSLVSEKLNIARHRKRNETLALVTEDWIKDPYKFSSGDMAGLFYSEWLEKKGISYTPRIVAEWIRKFAKRNNITFR